MLGPDEPRPGCAGVMGYLDRLGEELHERQEAAELAIASMGISFTVYAEKGNIDRAWPFDVIPRVIELREWEQVSKGLIQRLRALNLFIGDLYGEARVLADGIVPAEIVKGSPNYRPECIGIRPPQGTWAHISGSDLVRGGDGVFRVLEDNLRVPSGLGYAVSNRRTAAAALPMLHPWPGLRSPESIGAVLHAALAASAPPGCPRSSPRVAVLSDGPSNSAWYEHRLLADAMGVPVVQPDELRGDADGVTAAIGGREVPIDVLYRRLGDDELIDGPPISESANALLLAASRVGSVSVVNTPGNGVADDKAMYAFVHTMITYYLGEEALIGDVGTWVLADPDQYEGVRNRLHELVVKPVDGSGGAGVMIGPDLTEVEIAAMRAEVEAAPHRFIAQEVIRFSSHPTLTAGGLAPRHVDLRVFALAGRDGEVTVPDVALSRVALESEGLLVNSSRGGGSKDTWLWVH
jgi:uncharacterized circularly permuted ATP-grasp superfamily protein